MRVSRHRGLVLVAILVTESGCSTGTEAATTTVPPATTMTTSYASVAAGEPYQFHIHCGMRYIRGIDGRNWESDEPPYDGVGPFPEELRVAFVDPNEAVSPVVLGSIEITGNTLVFRVRNSDITIVYYPTSATIPPCA